MALKPPIHGRDHSPGGADPIPATSSAIQTFHFTVSNFAIGPGFTAIDWGSPGGFNDGTTVDVTAGADIRINAAGTYRMDLYSGGWVLGSSVTSALEWLVNVTSGSIGRWGSDIAGTSNEGASSQILSAELGSPLINAGQYIWPEFSATAAWGTGDTFPVVIQTQLNFTVDNVDTAESPNLACMVTRLGDTYE